VPAHAGWLIWVARRTDSRSIAETAKLPNVVRAGILLLIWSLLLFIAIEFAILLSNDGYFIVSPIFGKISII
jgi:hypothetical protein